MTAVELLAQIDADTNGELRRVLVAAQTSGDPSPWVIVNKLGETTTVHHQPGALAALLALFGAGNIPASQTIITTTDEDGSAVYAAVVDVRGTVVSAREVSTSGAEVAQ